MTSAPPDLWHHYGRLTADADRSVPTTFRWSWDQASGPGPEILGDLAGGSVGDLGAGAGRHAAYLATHHGPARVVAVDGSPAQYAMATGLYSHLAPRLRIVRADAVTHLRQSPHAYSVLYSVFGAVDFSDPYALLPAAAQALRPGGRLVFATLAHYIGGRAAESEVVPGDVSAKTPDGDATTMPRWVLQEQVWTKTLDEAGFTEIGTQVLPAAGDGPRTADTLLVTCSVPV
ncbi:class I SAM-dependent methyltransferase [Streptomyces tsukubensis]|uniref:class I SAM-dependent methyltransferase n=1 Tax=Streptomyces tsukubensis TaxID=83656 RepID=UPI0036A6770B